MERQNEFFLVPFPKICDLSTISHPDTAGENVFVNSARWTRTRSHVFYATLSFSTGWDLNPDNETSVTRPTKAKISKSYKTDNFNSITKETM